MNCRSVKTQGKGQFILEHLSFRSFCAERRSGDMRYAFISLREGTLEGEFSLVSLLKPFLPETNSAWESGSVQSFKGGL